ncbi:MAG: hypothetical protein U0Q15_18400 [Kineosporiaceae bacterium]
MRPTIVILTEESLTAGDAAGLLQLHPEEPAGYLVLVPADPHRNLLADVLDHLSLLELREALQALRGHEEPGRAEASVVLDASVGALKAAGADAAGRISDGDPVSALEAAVAEVEAREVVVVTRPHAVEDTFHRDWASQARERLGVPVLHLYGGTTMLG